jgi:hypothetical protein
MGLGAAAGAAIGALAGGPKGAGIGALAGAQVEGCTMRTKTQGTLNRESRKPMDCNRVRAFARHLGRDSFRAHVTNLIHAVGENV